LRLETFDTSAIRRFRLYFRFGWCTVARVARNGSRSIAKRGASESWQSTRTRRIVQLLLLFVGVLIVVDALVGDQGLLVMLRARRQHDELAAAIASQRAENARLREEARRLTEDPAAIEEVARRELGLIRRGEKVFIIKDLKP